MRDTATANGKLGTAVRAEYLRGKAAGLYDRIEHSAANEFARMSDAELRQIIVDQAKALEALGIDLLPAPKANPKKHWAIAWAHGSSAVEALREIAPTPICVDHFPCPTVTVNIPITAALEVRGDLRRSLVMASVFVSCCRVGPGNFTLSLSQIRT